MNYHLVQSHFETEEIEEIASITRSLGLVVDQVAKPGDRVELESLLLPYTNLPEVLGVAILDSSGAVLAAHFSTPETIQASFSPLPNNIAAVAQQTLYTHTEHYQRLLFNGESVLVHVLPLQGLQGSQSGQPGVAIAILELEEMHQSSQTFLLTSSATMLGMALVLLVCMQRVTRRNILEPLKRLTTAIQASPDVAHFVLPESLPHNEIRFLGTALSAAFQSQRQAEGNLHHRTQQLQNHNAILNQLANHRLLKKSDWDVVARVITQTTAQTLDVARVSIWLYNPERSHLHCLDLFERASHQHTAGLALPVASFPNYFHAIDTEENLIVACDAHTDPRTAEFSESYLTPLDIRSLLDAAIRLDGKTVGVLCIEQTQTPRQWNPEDESFVRSVADLIALTIEARDRLETEAQLQETQSFLQSVIDHVPIGIFVKRADDLSFVAWNKAEEEMIGLSAADVFGKSDRDFFPPDQAEFFVAKDREVLNSRQPLDIPEEPIQTPDKGLRFLHTQKVPIYDAEGNPRYLLGISEDITARKQAEQILLESEKRFRTLVANLPGAVYRYQCDEAWTLDFISEAIFEISGYPATDFLNPSVRTMASIVHPDDRLMIDTTLRQAIAEKHPYRLEYRILHADGSVQWIYEKGQGVFDEAGQLTCLDGVMFNISDRKQAEAQLQESRQLLQLVMDNIPQLIFWKDRHSVFLGSNQKFAEVAGLSSPQAIIGKTDYDLPWTKEEADHYQACDRRIMESGQPELHIIETQLQADGQTVWIDTNKIPLRNAAGEIVGILGTAEDITLRKQAEEALLQSELKLRQQADDLQKALRALKKTQAHLVQSEKMSSLGQMVAGVAHEINNPVNFIFGNIAHATEYTHDIFRLLNLYQHHYPVPVPEIQVELDAIDLEFLMSDFCKLLSSMKVGADRIREIVRSLRTFSRLDEAEFKAADLHEGIDSTLMILYNRLKAKEEQPEIQVVKEYGNLPVIDCYPGQLNQVFMNILSNAIDALEEHNQNRSIDEIKANPSCIRIQTTLIEQDRVRIRFSDNGPGIRDSVRSKLFDPFFTTKSVGKGTGLGLSISYQIVVEKHQGTLYCLSELGKGAEFIVELPIYQRSSEAA